MSPANGSPAGRVAIVTGGSRGAGRLTAGRLAGRGDAVVVNYLHGRPAAEATVEAVLAGNGAAMTVRADVTDELDVQRLFAETIEAFGGVDIVVHTVGGLLAAFRVNREAARHLRSGGAIVNLSNGFGEVGDLTRALAADLRTRDITVNAVAFEAGRPCAPDRVADCIAYLLGGRLTGQVLADGQ